MDYVKKFYIRFNRAIEESGFTLRELSEKTKIPLRALRRYTADRIPKARALCKICIALHVSADYLLSIGENDD